MKAGRRTYAFLAGTALVWLLVMGLVYRANRGVDDVDPLSLSSEITVKKETKQFFGIHREGVKSGYMIASQLSLKGLRVLREEVVLKVNLSGISRELFIRSTTGIDSVTGKMLYLDCHMQSGEHDYFFKGTVHRDSLLINIKSNAQTPWRRGMFPVDENVVPLTALPFLMHYSPDSSFTRQVFDPVRFSPLTVKVVRGEAERRKIAGVDMNLRRYYLDFDGKRSVVWLDSLGRMVREEGAALYGEALGEFTVEQDRRKDVFMLPIETTLGKDVLDSLRLSPGLAIPNPRTVKYMEIELDGIRAPGIDTDAPNKEVKSFNPVVLAIHDTPVFSGDRLKQMLVTMSHDTSLTGTSDYIQSKDARMSRTARGIVAAGTDTLSMARAIGRWVSGKMKRDEQLTIARSSDVLHDLRGGRDEYVKLFTALTRSIGIATQINTGLVYDKDAFVYHSWPSVFAGGTWHDLDPWYGQDTADAARVSLVRGDFEHLSEYLKLVNILSLKVLTYR